MGRGAWSAIFADAALVLAIVGIAALVLAIAMLVAYLVSRRLQRTVTELESRVRERTAQL